MLCTRGKMLISVERQNLWTLQAKSRSLSTLFLNIMWMSSACRRSILLTSDLEKLLILARTDTGSLRITRGEMVLSCLRKLGPL
ncbi:unnamed protein product [Dracunculus medinensis]|uniref:Uncharacterized protein n=1 Tax=Dracunculus medinensis TaxID=318479 RepID=A0A0N4U3J4_DRAME|nr:unnamed protein product [Dracunculus medinensis]